VATRAPPTEVRGVVLALLSLSKAPKKVISRKSTFHQTNKGKKEKAGECQVKLKTCYTSALLLPTKMLESEKHESFALKKSLVLRPLITTLIH
jgi:hypothetical protein